MKKLKRLEELTVDLQRQVIGGESLTGTCYCSCDCSCDCDCSCACQTLTYATSGSNRSGNRDSKLVNTRSNCKQRTTDNKTKGRKNELYYIKN